jgi:hypothetical protein
MLPFGTTGHSHQYLMIAELVCQKSLALFAKLSRSRRVSSFFFLRGMLASVKFDNQPLLDATKIGKVRTKSVLAAEFEAACLVRAGVHHQHS